MNDNFTFKNEIGVLKFFAKNMKWIPKKYVAAVIFSTIIKGFSPFITVIFPKYIIDELQIGKRIDIIAVFIGLSAGLAFSISLISKILDAYIKPKNLDVVNMFTAKTGLLLMEIPYENLESPSFTDLKERAMYPVEVRGVLDQLITFLPEFAKNMITLAGMFAIVLTFDILVVVLIFAILLLNMYFNKIYNEISIKTQKESIKNNKMFRYMSSMPKDRSVAKDVRIFNAASFIMEKVEQFDIFMLDNAHRQNTIIYTFEALKVLLSIIQRFFLYLFIGIKTIEKALTVGSFTMYISAATSLGESLTKITEQIMELRLTLRYLIDYVELNETPREFSSEKKADFISDEVEIEFKNLWFKYPKTEEYVLKNINFTIRQGESLSIVGRNGAGKTTFIKLLSRLYKSSEGEILLNGVNINEIDYKSYIEKISVVFQDFKIFGLSVADNVWLNYAKSEEKLYSALALAGIKDYIDTLPKKHETLCAKEFGEGSTEFSGGQAQKLAIARTIYKNADIVILDEPTAALDPLAEAEVFEKFNDIIENRTAIYISHRLSSSKFCERIIFIDEGTIKEEGNHRELMEKDGLYASMFNLQAQAYV